MALTQEQMLSMLKLQEEMNAMVNLDWRNAGYNWARAIMVEAVEAIEHHGWKWWKKQEPDMPQLQMELVDIWHFMLSLAMTRSRLCRMKDIAASLTQEISDIQKYPTRMFFHGRLYAPDCSLLDTLQVMAGIGAGGDMDIHVFSQAMEKAGMSWNDLYVSYIGKNCLNRFRQMNGYKTGTYIKDWSCVPLSKSLKDVRTIEDNDHLHDLIQESDISMPDLFEQLMNGLQARYDAVKSATV